jgi:hypothetical protein
MSCSHQTQDVRYQPADGAESELLERRQSAPLACDRSTERQVSQLRLPERRGDCPVESAGYVASRAYSVMAAWSSGMVNGGPLCNIRWQFGQTTAKSVAGSSSGRSSGCSGLR